MAIVQPIRDGKVVEDTSGTSASGKKKKEVNGELGQDQFLQLLVAQMQYQDPLQPTSNTEWVAQMATFSMVESLNSLKDTMIQQSSYDLVGKYVFINDGDNGYVKGKVDYITERNGETVLAIGDEFYPLSKLDTVADEEYYNGSILAKELHEMIQLLPDEETLNVLDDGLVKSAREAYDALTETQKKFVSEDDLTKLRALETKMNALKATHFTGMVNLLPTAEKIQAADKDLLAAYVEQLAEANAYYEGLNALQKKNVAESTLKELREAEKEIAAASKKLDASEGDGTSGTDVSALLQKILEEIQKQNKSET